MNKYLLLLTAVFYFESVVFSQNFNFKYSEDDNILSEEMMLLAKNVSKLDFDKTKKKSLNDLYRLQAVSKDYSKALISLELLRDLYKEDYKEFSKIIGINYEAYIRIQMEKQVSKKEDQNRLFSRIVDSIYLDISEQTKNDSFFYFEGVDKNRTNKSFNKLLLKTKGKDSISRKLATEICVAYFNNTVALSIGELGKNYVKKERNKKYIIQDSLFIKTIDKSLLSTLIVRKKKDTIPLPVILKFSIYPSQDDTSDARLAADYGYVGVVVNTRGKKYSKGKTISFEKDGEDLYDVIDWISKQPWCNGKVGMYGGSYLGFAQWAGTKKLHPALKTIVPMVSVGPGIDYPMYNNVFMSYMLRWIHYVENNKFTDREEFSDEKRWDSLYIDWYKKGVAFNTLDNLDKRPNKTFQKWLKHPSYDSYWQKMMPYRKDFSKIDIPVLSFTGYYDSDQRGALHYYKKHLKHNPNAKHYMVIGPYDHGGAQGFPSKIINGYEIDSVAAGIRQIPITFRWFDYIFKNAEKPSILKDKFNYQVMGTNQWKSKKSIYGVANDTLNFYLDSSIDDRYFKLSKLRSNKKSYIEEKVDFLDRSSYDTFQKKPERILDTIFSPKGRAIFISKPFENDFEISGSFSGQIDLIINKKDVDVSIELYEVTGEGKYFALSTYLARASYAKNRSKRNLLKPNKKESFPIKNSSFTSKLIKKGSRLLVNVSVNKNPYWQINYGSGKDVSKETIKDGKTPLKIKWMNTSRIDIPVFKYN